MSAHVAIVGRDQTRTEGTAREIRAAGGGQVDAFLADMSSQSEVRRLADEVLDRLPQLDVLINNVGDRGTRAMSPPTALSGSLGRAEDQLVECALLGALPRPGRTAYASVSSSRSRGIVSAASPWSTRYRSTPPYCSSR